MVGWEKLLTAKTIISKKVNIVFIALSIAFILQGQKSDQIVATGCKKKEADLLRSASFSFMSTGNYYATEIASTGQTSAHDPQSVQRSASIL